MKIQKIDDPQFREAIMQTFSERDSPRRYEIHFTDLINCLFCSFQHKVLLDEPSDDRYDAILTWARGLAFDSVITSRISKKTLIVLGGAQGEVDMVFQGMPYELTSSLFMAKATKESDDLAGRYQYKQTQLRYYMAALSKPIGRLKIIEQAGQKHQNESLPGTREHTWQIEMTPLELSKERRRIIDLAIILKKALQTGRWQMLRDFSPITGDSRCASASETDIPICQNYLDTIRKPVMERTLLSSWRTWIKHPSAQVLMGVLD